LLYLTPALLLLGIVEPFRLLIVLFFKTNLERFGAAQIENILQDTIANLLYAVSHHSDVYSGTAIAVCMAVPLQWPRTAAPL